MNEPTLVQEHFDGVAEHVRGLDGNHPVRLGDILPGVMDELRRKAGLAALQGEKQVGDEQRSPRHEATKAAVAGYLHRNRPLAHQESDK